MGSQTPEDMVRNTAEQDPTRAAHDAERSDAQLDMLHSFAAKLNVLTDTTEIGNAITGELRTIIDYHNCRVYLLQPDRETLMPIAFRGEMTTEYFEEDLDALVTAMGEGITGTVAATRGVAAHARRPGGDVLGHDRGHRRRPARIDAGGADGRRRRRRGRDRALEPRLRHVRRRGPAHARGAGPARRGGVPRCAAARGGARRRPGGGRAPAAVAGAHRPAHARRHLPRCDRDDPDDHPMQRLGGLRARCGDGRFPTRPAPRVRRDRAARAARHRRRARDDRGSLAAERRHPVRDPPRDRRSRSRPSIGCSRNSATSSSARCVGSPNRWAR